MGLRLPTKLSFKGDRGVASGKSWLSDGQLPGQLGLSGKIFGWLGQPDTPYFEHCMYIYQILKNIEIFLKYSKS